MNRRARYTIRFSEQERATIDRLRARERGAWAGLTFTEYVRKRAVSDERGDVVRVFTDVGRALRAANKDVDLAPLIEALECLGAAP